MYCAALQLIQDSLHYLVVKNQDFSTIDGNISLIDRIAAVHVVHETNCESIHWFGQLTFHSPGILEGLAESVKQTAGQDEVSVCGKAHKLVAFAMAMIDGKHF